MKTFLPELFLTLLQFFDSDNLFLLRKHLQCALSSNNWMSRFNPLDIRGLIFLECGSHGVPRKPSTLTTLRGRAGCY